MKDSLSVCYRNYSVLQKGVGKHLMLKIGAPFSVKEGKKAHFRVLFSQKTGLKDPSTSWPKIGRITLLPLNHTHHNLIVLHRRVLCLILIMLEGPPITL